jgi:hypothetical protein
MTFAGKDRALLKKTAKVIINLPVRHERHDRKINFPHDSILKNFCLNCNVCMNVNCL